ncbi:hypothetical protein CTI12_AA523880 [Artemisia annua]|uniref:chorismate synthase n=1 Tax=Artemisia annua TaxID=35608 RepID=A0A2U1L6V0_ARTAN|nr:hypothetical protein CTI12_AA523880 [Artemisia annua]
MYCAKPPRGLGSPVFDKLEAELAKTALSIPATKGFEFGNGFAGRGVKQKRGGNVVIAAVSKGNSDDGTTTSIGDKVSSTIGHKSHADSSSDDANLAAKIRDIKSLMLEGKLVLVGDDGNPLKSSDSGIDKVTLQTCESFDATMNDVNSQSDTSGFVLVKEKVTNVVVELDVQTTPISFASVVNNESVNRKVQMGVVS